MPFQDYSIMYFVFAIMLASGFFVALLGQSKKKVSDVYYIFCIPTITIGLIGAGLSCYLILSQYHSPVYPSMISDVPAMNWKIK